MTESRRVAARKPSRDASLKFVLLIGVLSFFADFTYEGSRGITGPFLAILGASGTLVGIVAGLGELLGYGLRVVSGQLSQRTQGFWPITLFGYFIQMLSVPLLALAGDWKTAALLILVERVGKAIRNPPRDVMLSYAAKEVGYGWAFGAHEALDQSGALVGPLLMAAVLSSRGDYRLAFGVLAVPAVVTLSFLLLARVLYPRPEDLDASVPDVRAEGLPRVFWVYLGGAALVAAGFADFQLITYHFEKADALDTTWIPIMYSIAMAVSGAGSLVFGRMFDRLGIRVLIPLTLVSAVFAPLVFLGGFWPLLVGSALWGLGMGVHESIVPAAVATMVPRGRRPSAYGLFTAGYGVAWFIGSAIMGILYDVSVTAVVIFCVALQLAAVPIFVRVLRAARSTSETPDL
jgi:MFS family permease